jgi:hypothetical protein
MAKEQDSINVTFLKELYTINQTMKITDRYFYDFPNRRFIGRIDNRYFSLVHDTFNELVEEIEIKYSFAINGKEFFDIFKECKKPSFNVKHCVIRTDEGDLSQPIYRLHKNNSGEFEDNKFAKDFEDESKIIEFDIETVEDINPIEEELTFHEVILNIYKDKETYFRNIVFNRKNKSIVLKKFDEPLEKRIFLTTDQKTFLKYKTLKKNLPHEYMKAAVDTSNYEYLKLEYGNDIWHFQVEMNGIFKY